MRGFTYKNSLTAYTVESAGDENFAAERQKWFRLANDAPIFAADERFMMAYTITKTAAAECEEVYSKNQEADTELFWTLLAAKQYNADQVSETRAAFNSAEMRRVETIQAYALRLKGLSRGLPECAFEKFVKQRFVNSMKAKSDAEGGGVGLGGTGRRSVHDGVVESHQRGGARHRRVEVKEFGGRRWERCGLGGSRTRTSFMHSRARTSGCRKKQSVWFYRTEWIRRMICRWPSTRRL
jgi:hypothetical protein